MIPLMTSFRYCSIIISNTDILFYLAYKAMLDKLLVISREVTDVKLVKTESQRKGIASIEGKNQVTTDRK